jgi:hypothetical protein
VEAIIHDAVKARLAWDKRMVAGLLHLQFHDCFVAVRTCISYHHPSIDPSASLLVYCLVVE